MQQCTYCKLSTDIYYLLTSTYLFHDSPKTAFSLTHTKVPKLVLTILLLTLKLIWIILRKSFYFFTQEIENLSCQLEETKGPFPLMDPRRIKELEDALTKVEHDKTNLIRVK